MSAIIGLSQTSCLFPQRYTLQMSNAPDRFLSWRWEDEADADRLTYQPDSKKPNAGTFVMKKEDHTIGNLLRMQMLRDPGVRYAGYRLPHPLIMECHVRVETMDSKLTPPQVNSVALATSMVILIIFLSLTYRSLSPHSPTFSLKRKFWRTSLT